MIHVASQRELNLHTSARSEWIFHSTTLHFIYKGVITALPKEILKVSGDCSLQGKLLTVSILALNLRR